MPFALLAAVLQVACTGRSAGAPAPASPRGEADIVLRDVSFDRLSEGRMDASGTAAEVLFNRNGRFEARSARAVIRAVDDGQNGLVPLGDLTVAAPEVTGEIDVPAPHRAVVSFRAGGGVSLRAARGDRADTDHVEVDGPAGLVHARAPVVLSGPGYRTRAASMEARTDGSRIALAKVEGELVAEEARP